MIQVVCTDQNDYVLSYKNFDKKEPEKVLECVKECLDNKDILKINIIKYPFKDGE